MPSRPPSKSRVIEGDLWTGRPVVETSLQAEMNRLAEIVLRALPPRDQEVLTRFYLRRQPAEQICAEMGIADLELRLVKAQAETRFNELVRQPPPRRRGSGKAVAVERGLSSEAIDPGAVRAAADLLRAMGAREVFIFGSAVTGGVRPDSDVDLAVTGLPSQVYFSASSKASEIFSRPVDLVDLDDPTPLVRYLLESGELVRVE